MVPQRMVGGVHALLREELGDEAVARDDAVRAQQQQREERPLLRPPGRDLRVVDPNAERSQDPELETHSHRAFESPPRRSLFPAAGDASWDRLGTRASDPRGDDDAVHRQVLLARRHRGRASCSRCAVGAPTRRSAARTYCRGDDLVLALFEGESAFAVKRAGERAGMPCERVIEAVWIAPPVKPKEER